MRLDTIERIKRMKCKECNYKYFLEINGSPNRYYCEHPDSLKERGCLGSCLICKTERHSHELTTKTAPKWCPLNKKD